VDEIGRPVRIIITSGTVNDCTKADELTEGIKTDGIIADRGYDTNAIIESAVQANIRVIIPPKKTRKVQRVYDTEVYKLRHFVENAFAVLKRWRGIATRYAKHTTSYLAAVQIACIAGWGNFIVDTL
jgi:transposase